MTFDLNLDLKNEVLGEEKSLRRFEDQKWKFAIDRVADHAPLTKPAWNLQLNFLKFMKMWG